MLLFIVAGLIALLLNPFVSLLRRARFPRGLAVLTVMATVVLVVVGIGFLLANPVADQVSAFQSNVPGIVDDANASLADFQDWLDRNGIDVQVKEEGQTALQTLGEQPLARARASSSRSRSDALQILVEASIALILVIVLSVYMLLYGERIGADRALDGAARRRHAGGRLPDPHPGRGLRLRARPAAVLADHGHERGRRCCGCSARSGSSPTARRTRSSSAPGTASPS